MNVLMGDSKPSSPVFAKTGLVAVVNKDINNANTKSSNTFNNYQQSRNELPY
jgi:hypothetical protein